MPSAIPSYPRARFHDDASVQGLEWEKFQEWFGTQWRPGEHISIVAPTGAGKTTLAGGILEGRRFVLVTDPKGGDETLAGLQLRRLDAWPGESKMSKLLDEDEKKHRPSRYIIGPIIHEVKDVPKLKTAISAALDGAFNMGGWTVYVDELQVAHDRRMMDLSAQIDQLLVMSRSRKVSMVGSFQAPSWVGTHAIRQPTWIMTSYTRDTDVVNRIAEILGRPKPEIRGALRGLEKYCWIVIGRDPRAPIIVTSPPKIEPKRT